jgi:hypothetical protein
MVFIYLIDLWEVYVCGWWESPNRHKLDKCISVIADILFFGEVFDEGIFFFEIEFQFEIGFTIVFNDFINNGLNGNLFSEVRDVLG